MRTTLDIDDDVMQVAKEIARLKNQGIGQALSDLARRGLTPEVSSVELRDSIPVWTHAPGAITITNEMVRNLLDGE